MDLALRDLGFDPSMIGALHDMFDFMDETAEQKPQHPSRAYIRDSKAMRATPADVIEYPNAYQFLVDMPGLKPDQVKVQLEDENVLVVSGERKREKQKEEKEGIKYLRMERRLGKFLKKFVLPENANTDAISAAFQDGVLVVTVEKRPPPEPKKPKVIEVKLGGGGESSGVQETHDEGGAGQQVQDGTPGVKTD
ncbi:18.8 kDa class II heat shock protein [Datura stramonium]|uniref:18.8 kDa class II heat shock protein n=1 Tax=Datura stramonium TaxID=4076 RepID=A0ABS8RVB2_DATST|nr:18.8 kDa class II heat shock protein [Datura stramonium]